MLPPELAGRRNESHPAVVVAGLGSIRLESGIRTVTRVSQASGTESISASVSVLGLVQKYAAREFDASPLADVATFEVLSAPVDSDVPSRNVQPFVRNFVGIPREVCDAC